jgi:Domain of unknown function (DUF4328)
MSGFPPYQVASPPVAAWPKPLDGLSKVVTVGLIGCVVAAAIGLAIQASSSFGGAALDVVHPALIIVALLVTGIAFICWLHRARVNLYYFGVYDLRWKPGWTIGAWFIPIVNIVIPLLVVNEVDRASEQRAGASSGGRSVFVLWAISWSGFLLLDRYTSVATPSIVDLSARDLDRFSGLSVIATGLQIAAALFAIRLVRRITTNQQRVLAGGAPTYARPTDYGQPPGPDSQPQPQPQSSGPPQAYAQPQAPAHSASSAPADLPPEPYRPPTSPSGGPPTSGESASPDPPPPDPLRPPSDPWPSAGF